MNHAIILSLRQFTVHGGFFNSQHFWNLIKINHKSNFHAHELLLVIKFFMVFQIYVFSTAIKKVCCTGHVRVRQRMKSLSKSQWRKGKLCITIIWLKCQQTLFQRAFNMYTHHNIRCLLTDCGSPVQKSIVSIVLLCLKCRMDFVHVGGGGAWGQGQAHTHFIDYSHKSLKHV